MRLNKDTLRIVVDALAEDIGTRDITTAIAIMSSQKEKAQIIAKEDLIVCGIDIARKVFELIDGGLKVKKLKKDGDFVKKGEKVITLCGKDASILIAERVALNFLAYLSGIATYTNSFVSEIKSKNVQLMDTRKTTPTLRSLEKYAVRTGGGKNHRFGLWDGVIIKDNHLRACGVFRHYKIDHRKLEQLMIKFRKRTKLPIEIEVDNLKQFRAVIEHKPDVIMLDNFTVANLKKAVKLRDENYPKIKLEASGGVNLKTISKIAQTGVDFISAGTITHSAKAVDFSLEILDE